MISAELLKDRHVLVTGSDSEHGGGDFSGLLPDCPVDVSLDEEDDDVDDDDDDEGGEETPGSPLEHSDHGGSESFMTECFILGLDGLDVPPGPDGTSRLMIPGRNPGGIEDTVHAAAHLHLLGESLSLIGQHLQDSNKLVCVWRGLSLLLDSLLCGVAPLMLLTLQLPELISCTPHTLPSTLENISYFMPGL